jgi:hypothetical protein
VLSKPDNSKSYRQFTVWEDSEYAAGKKKLKGAAN